MVNSLVELVVVSGSYGWQPMRPALFAVLLFEFTGIVTPGESMACRLAKRYRATSDIMFGFLE
ncbi:hypothetical protein WL80_31500 [Burkholderia ubonensis]|nr:hypothetical protein WL80_31500 [Burkholderia ubonensis]